MTEQGTMETAKGTAAPVAPRKENEERNPSTLRRFRFLLAGAAIVLLAAGIWAWRYFGSYESTDDAQVDGHINLISARISGYVTEVDVNDNQYVEKGTVLVRIDPSDYQVAVEKARAELENAKASANAMSANVPITSVNTKSQLSTAQADVESARAGISAAEQQAAAAQAQWKEAEANDAKAQSDVQRYKQLVDKQEISAQQYEQAVTTAQATAASVAAARASAAAALQQVAQARARLAQAEASVRTAGTWPEQMASTRSQAASAQASAAQKQAELDQAQLNLQYTTIVAPVSGVVSKNVELGMNVQPGQQLLSIVPLDDVWITANFKETQLRNMRAGQRVVIRWMRTAATTRAAWKASPGPAGRASACCRRKTPRAIT